MKRLKCLLLACLMLVSVFPISASAALPETVEPLWSNTADVVIRQDIVGTTVHCYVDIGIYSGAIIRNVSIRFIQSGSGDFLKTWTDPEMTLGAGNVYSFYDTVEDVPLGSTYRLVFQCEVWRNGVCDYISRGCNAYYSATE